MKTDVLNVSFLKNVKSIVVTQNFSISIVFWVFWVLVLFFYCFFFFFLLFSWSLQRCSSLAETFSTWTKNGRRLVELLFFSVVVTDSILIKRSNSAFGINRSRFVSWSTNYIRQMTFGSHSTSTILIFALILILILIVIPFIISIFFIIDFTAFVRWNTVNNFI